MHPINLYKKRGVAILISKKKLNYEHISEIKDKKGRFFLLITGKIEGSLVSFFNVAMTRLKTGKSPGADGYTAEWYKIMFKHLALTLLKALNWVVQKREILPSWREAIISVIWSVEIIS